MHKASTVPMAPHKAARRPTPGSSQRARAISPGRPCPLFSAQEKPALGRREKPLNPEIVRLAAASAVQIDLRVRIPPHDSFPIPPIRSKTGRGDGPFSPVAPGRRRRGFSQLPTLCRRLVIPGHDTQSPWDAEALVLECRPRASQANRAPSLIVRRGGVPGLLPVPETWEGRACCPPEHFPRHRWLRASQSVRMAWPVAGDFARREVQR